MDLAKTKNVPVALRMRVKALVDAQLSVDEIFERLCGSAVRGGSIPPGGVDPASVAEILGTVHSASFVSVDPTPSVSAPVKDAGGGKPLPPRGGGKGAKGGNGGGAGRKVSPQVSLFAEASRLFSLLDIVVSGEEPGIVVQFIGSRHGEGTSTMAREFARVAAVHSDRPVLLMDLDLRNGDQYEHFAANDFGDDQEPQHPGPAVDVGIDLGRLIRHREDWSAREDGRSLISIHQVGDSSLHVTRLHPDLRQANSKPQVTRVPAVWEQLREHFSLTVIDSPPLVESFDGLAISGMADRVLVVVEAESTRIPVVEELCDRLVSQNAQIAGVVYNKRRLYIPRLIYRWL